MQIEELVARENLTTATEVRRWHHDKNTILGNSQLAELFIIYQPKKGYEQKDVFNELIDFLEKNGFTEVESSTTQPDVYEASLIRQDYEFKCNVQTHESEHSDFVGLGIISMSR